MIFIQSENSIVLYILIFTYFSQVCVCVFFCLPPLLLLFISTSDFSSLLCLDILYLTGSWKKLFIKLYFWWQKREIERQKEEEEEEEDPVV